MNNNIIKRKKNWIFELIIFLLLMLALMINDAMDHPEDFIKGYNSVINSK